jgi:hypothetical protein
VFVAKENIVCTLKWPSLKAKFGKTKKSKFYKIEPWNKKYPLVQKNRSDIKIVVLFIKVSF